MPPDRAMTAEKALAATWFERNLTVERFFAEQRDRFLLGKPLWVTETAEAACGGDPLASQFADSLRLLDQLGSLAQSGVKSVMINALAASDYGLIDGDTLEPRPDYWAAVIWKRTKGSRSCGRLKVLRVDYVPTRNAPETGRALSPSSF